MFFVWSGWIIVVILMIAVIVAGAVLLVKMNKKDVQLIDEFQKENAVEEVVAEEAVEQEQAETKSAAKQDEFTCHYCGAIVDKGARKCPDCGARLEKK